jgi:LmbE family N-acetylglucosaminyl deacetylase
MTNALKLLAVFAHPDDESLGNGGTFAKYAAEGVETYLVMATRGQQGWFGDPADYPGAEALGAIREGELRAAATTLGIREVSFLDYQDGELERADANTITAEIAEHIRRIRPDVVLTFDPVGFYGHPDHMAICRFTTSAIALASNLAFESDLPAHSVTKLYYMAWTPECVLRYEKVFGELTMNIDGELRTSAPWPTWAITTRIDVEEYWHSCWEAISHHRSQLPAYEKLLALSQEEHVELWGKHLYYRVFGPTDTHAGEIEDDLFSGIRPVARVEADPREAVLAG